MTAPPQPLRVFISYSHRDDEWREKLVKALSLQQRQGLLELWHDRRIVGGEDWAQTIDEKLGDADIVLLLVSRDFMASEYCFGIEMNAAMKQHKEGRTHVVPILMRSCDWKTAPFARCQGFPRDNLPVAKHPKGEDAALTEVAEGLRELADEWPVDHSQGRVDIFKPLSWWQRHRRILRVGGAGGSTLLLIGASLAFVQANRAVEQGERDLRVGAYERAAEHFASARRWNPFAARARWDARLARLGNMIPDLERQGAEFARALEDLERERPDDPYVSIFKGDLAFDRFRRSGDPAHLKPAVQAYRQAASADDSLPEAHARLAFVLDLADELPQSEKAWRKALHLAGNDHALVARYRNDLAGVLAQQQGKTEEALRLYEGNSDSAQSQLEGALLHWQRAGTGDALELAGSRLGRARELLAAPSRTPATAWGFKAAGTLVLFGRRESQTCLTALALATNDYLLKNTEPARAAIDQLFRPGDCPQVKADALLVVCDRLATAAARTEAGAAHRLSAARDWLQCSAPVGDPVVPVPGEHAVPEILRRSTA